MFSSPIKFFSPSLQTTPSPNKDPFFMTFSPCALPHHPLREPSEFMPLLSPPDADMIHTTPAQARLEVSRKASKRKLFGQYSSLLHQSDVSIGGREPCILFDESAEWVNDYTYPNSAIDSVDALEKLTSSQCIGQKAFPQLKIKEEPPSSTSEPDMLSVCPLPVKRFVLDTSFRDYLRILGNNPISLPSVPALRLAEPVVLKESHEAGVPEEEPESPSRSYSAFVYVFACLFIYKCMIVSLLRY
jgi:hypothetical protein